MKSGSLRTALEACSHWSRGWRAAVLCIVLLVCFTTSSGCLSSNANRHAGGVDQPIAADDFFAGKALPGSPASCAPATVDTNDPGDYFLDLDEALALAEADNPTIALATEAVGASRAR